MSQRDYPSPDTITSSDCGDLHDPSPDSSFGSLHAHKGKGEGESKSKSKSQATTVANVVHEVAAVDEQVQQALDIVRSRRNGRPLSVEHDGWIKLELTPTQYRRFYDELGLHGLAGFFNTKIRHDYDPQRCLLAFRMPSPIHDAFGLLLLDEVNDWIKRVRAEPLPRATRAIISPIISVGTSDITWQVPSRLLPSELSTNREGTATHSPDGQFTYLGHRRPPFVMEIGYSSKGKGQAAKNLPGLAKHYYEEVDIKTVLTVDLAYMPKAQRREERQQRTQRQTRTATARQTNRQASLSLYRGPDCVISNRLFRNEAGGLVDGEGLSLHISDLVPDAVLAKGNQGLDAPLFTLQITARTLFDILAKSEAVQQDREKTASVPPEEPRKRKVTWALDDESSDGDNVGSQEENERSGPASTSKRHRTTSDAAYSSRSGPSTPLGVRTRSRTRDSAGSIKSTSPGSRSRRCSTS